MGSALLRFPREAHSRCDVQQQPCAPLVGALREGAIDGLNPSIEIGVAAEGARLTVGWLGAGAVAAPTVANARRALRIYVAIRELEPTFYPEADRVRDRAFLAEP